MTNRPRALFVFVVMIGIAIVLGNAVKANASSDVTNHPRVEWPLLHRQDAGRPYQIVIEAKGHIWGLRAFAREADRELAGVRIYTGPHASCSARPAATCVRVHRADLGVDGGVGAVTSYNDEHGRRTITVNTHYGASEFPRYPVMCHEFGHVLGMQHHKGHGVDGAWPNEVHLSRAEVSALRAAYANGVQ